MEQCKKIMVEIKRVSIVTSTINKEGQIQIENPDYDEAFYEPIPESLNFNPLKQLFNNDINPTK